MPVDPQTAPRPRRRLVVNDLHRLVELMPPDVRDDYISRMLSLGLDVTRWFLGVDWVEANIRHDAPKRGFLRIDLSTDLDRARSIFRVVDLAECLFNLQQIAGFDECIDQMRAGAEKVESTCAELDFARLLYIHDIDFRFVVPSKVRKGEDYDFEITYPDGLVVPADAKCKFETTPVNVRSVHNSLRKARSQLPRQHPGIIFVKVPPSWIENDNVARALLRTGLDFFRHTRRVVSLKFYISQLLEIDGMLRHRLGFREITNSRSPFSSELNWDLFTDGNLSPHLKELPEKWQRIFLFPPTRTIA